MIRDRLKEEQPMVYEALQKSLLNHTVSHAYLFTGPSGTMKTEAAYLLAMSLFCQNTQDGFACETCSTCERVKNGGHLDFLVLDGSRRAISKADADRLQEKFSATSSEEGAGRRCCLILHAENSSLAAMNSLLKFLEEPGEGITAILTADNAGRLLPTIISRCTVVSFRSLPEKLRIRRAKEAGLSDDDAVFVSRLDTGDSSPEDFASGSAYENAMGMFRQFLNENGPFAEWLVDYDISYRLADKEENLRMLRIFLDLVNLYAHDVILGGAEGPEWYRRAVSEAKGTDADYGRLIVAVSHQKDLCSKYHDQNLLAAQIYQKLEVFSNELKKGNR